jgi:hypothetical protein
VEECGGKGGVIIEDAPAPAPVPPAPAA